MSGPLSTANLVYPAISAREPFEKSELVSEHQFVLSRTSDLSHPFPRGSLRYRTRRRRQAGPCHGVDMTRDFAMIAYLNDGDSLRAEFTTSVPTVASAWGTWRAEGMVHTHCGPQLCRPPSPTQTADLPPSGDDDAVQDEYNQCLYCWKYWTPCIGHTFFTFDHPWHGWP